MRQTLSKSLKDIVSKDVIIFVLQVGFGSLLLAGLFVWYFWQGMETFIISYLSWIPWDWLKTSGTKVITTALAYMIFIITVSVLTSLFSEKLLIKLAKKHYLHVPVVGSVNIQTSLIETLKSSGLFLILFILALPFVFIPFFGQVIMLYLWSVLIKTPTTYDVGSLFIEDKKNIKKKTKRTRLLAMIASLFNYLPVLNAFTPILAQILFLHHILGKEKV